MESVLRYFIDHFPDLMDINLTATIVILFVICVRQFLKRTPKIFSYALWGIVLLRLLVPVSIESPVSFVPERTEFSSMVEVNEVLPEIQFETPQDRADNEWYRENTPPGQPLPQVSRVLTAQDYLTFLWLFGIAVMLLYGFLSYWKLRHKLKVVVPYRKGILIADDIDSPFVMGVFRPTIYLPGSLEPWERTFIIAHERHHIRRGDHIFKALGFLALSIHWFNPLVWVAFFLAGRDMEMSCDEAVIRKLGEDVRADYSAALLNLATGHRIFAGTPLAFGEVNPTGRVRNLAKWRKPATWVVLICVIICIVLGVCLLTDPNKNASEETRFHEESKDIPVLEFPLNKEVIELTMERVGLPEEWVIEEATPHQPEGAESTLFILQNPTMELFDGVCMEIISHKYDGDSNTYGLDDCGILGIGISTIDQNEDFSRGEVQKAISFATYLLWQDVSDSRIYDIFIKEFDSFIENEEFYRKTHGAASPFIEDEMDGVQYIVAYTPIEEHMKFKINFQVPLTKSDYTHAMLDGAEETGETAPTSEWGVSIKPDRVSRTGATALFNYSGSVPGEDGAELTYGDFLSLDRLVDGTWIPCDELAGYDYYVGDSSYPVVDGYGMVHEWPDRFGELADGHYRLGKQVTLMRQDGSAESRMVYGEFSIPDSILTGPIPLEDLPEKYGSEQAMLDGCLVCPDGIARDNMEQFRSFVDACSRGAAGFFRVMYYYYGDDPHYIAYDIHYDGSKYTVNSMESGDGRISVFEFPYLKHFTGTKEREEYPYDAYEYYCFVGDADITWQEIFDGQYEGKFMPIFLNHIYYPKTPQLPASPVEATLEFEGEALVTTTDFDRLEKIWILFEDAEFLGYEPKTHSIGLGLNLILTSKSGESMTIELDPDNDLCRIDGEYILYGKPDEPNYIEKLWYYLGIEAWPDVVYDNYPNAFRN